jgi:hypothetical protein
MGVYEGKQKDTLDVSTPKYRQRSLRGDIINNPYRSTIIEHKVQSIGSWSIDRIAACTGTNFKSSLGTNFRQQMTAVGLMGLVPYAHDSFMELAQLAGTRAWANVQKPQLSGLVEMAQLGKSIALIRATSKRISSLLDNAKRRKLNSKRRKATLGEYLAGDWLSYRYGFSTLVYAMEDAFEAVAAPRVGKRQTARGNSASGVITSSDVQTSSDSFFDFELTRTNTISREVRSGVLYTSEFTTANRYGFGVSDIPSTLWELFPYSFVADWFVNVGDYIRAMTPKAGVRVLSEWTTTKDYSEQKGELASLPTQSSQYTYGGSCGGTYTIQTVKTVRNPSASRALTSLIPEINFQTPKDWLHVADGVALLGRRLLAG